MPSATTNKQCRTLSGPRSNWRPDTRLVRRKAISELRLQRKDDILGVKGARERLHHKSDVMIFGPTFITDKKRRDMVQHQKVEIERERRWRSLSAVDHAEPSLQRKRHYEYLKHTAHQHGASAAELDAPLILQYDGDKYEKPLCKTSLERLCPWIADDTSVQSGKQLVSTRIKDYWCVAGMPMMRPKEGMKDILNTMPLVTSRFERW